MEPDFDSQDPYRVLGVPPDVEARELKRAYRLLVKRFRPEREPERFQKIREAYEILQDRRGPLWELSGELDPGTEDPGALPVAPFREPGSHSTLEDQRRSDSCQDEPSALEPEGDQEAKTDPGGQPISGDGQHPSDQEARSWEQPLVEKHPDEQRPGIRELEGTRLLDWFPEAVAEDARFTRLARELEILFLGGWGQEAEARYCTWMEDLGLSSSPTGLRLRVYFVRAGATVLEPQSLQPELRQVERSLDLSEEAFYEIEVAHCILRARAKEDLARRKLPPSFVTFAFEAIDQHGEALDRQMARLRAGLRNWHKKDQDASDWMDFLESDFPDLDQVASASLLRHAEYLQGLVREERLLRRDGEPFEPEAFDSALLGLERDLDRRRRWVFVLNLSVFLYGLGAAFLAIRSFVIEGNHLFPWILLGTCIPLLVTAATRSLGYRFLVRPRVRAYLRRWQLPIGLLLAAVRLHDEVLPRLEHYFPALYCDGTLPPVYGERDFRKGKLPRPYLGNLHAG